MATADADSSLGLDTSRDSSFWVLVSILVVLLKVLVLNNWVFITSLVFAVARCLPVRPSVLRHSRPCIVPRRLKILPNFFLWPAAQRWQWVIFYDPWPTWPISQLTRGPREPWPGTHDLWLTTRPTHQTSHCYSGCCVP